MKQCRAMLSRRTRSNEFWIFMYKPLESLEIAFDDCISGSLEPRDSGSFLRERLEVFGELGPTIEAMRTRDYELRVA
jgi:hypothetical protein